MIKWNMQFFGGRGASSSGASGGGGMNAMNTQTQPTAQMASSANGSTFSDTDSSGYHNLYNGRKYFQQQNMTIDQQVACINYLSDTPETGSLYSMSQNMNYAMATGQPLTANQQYVHDQMMGAMHNMGYNTNLTRYDHANQVDGLLSQAGLSKSYTGYSESQLQSALVGTTFTENKFLSTSYNDFSKASDPSTFTTRQVKIKYQAPANTQVLMPGNGPGGALGEIVIAPGTKQTITGVRFNGNKARRQGSSRYNLNQPQLEITIQLG